MAHRTWVGFCIATLASSLAVAACGGNSSSDGAGGSDGGAGTAGSGGGAGTAGSGGGAGTAGSGGGSGACPTDLWAAVGTACSEEGKYCGGQDCDPCQFCNVVYCSGGKWQQQEAFPDPNCGDAGSKVCGGLAGKTCAGDEWCDLPDGCGYPDAQGVCKPRPQGCTADCPGVCGCDGKFYCNACGANAVGADVGADKSCLSGDGGAGSSCSSDTECLTGLKCCYPCGQAGCTNQCIVPMSNGQCPMYP